MLRIVKSGVRKACFDTLKCEYFEELTVRDILQIKSMVLPQYC